MTKWILSLVVLVSVSFVSYKAGQRSSSAAQSAEQIEEKVKEDLIELTRQDFEEYQNLKSLEDRYKKADEILGKIVTVFLADLGLKLGYKPTNPALLDAACSIAAPTATPVPSPEPSPMMSQETPQPTPTPAPKANWTRSEYKVRQARDEAEALEEARKLEIPDFFDAIKSSGAISNQEAQAVSGHFQGEITFFDRKAHKSDWFIEWEIPYNKNSKDDTFITLTDKRNGKTFSRTRTGNGKSMLSGNFSSPAGSKAVIVNVYGDDGYIQIYPRDNRGATWVGNYYEKEKLGQYKMAGQVTLNRTE
ncbi:hypothetical protein [Bdellovibrio sp. HCB-162]|uniref:hypothetical protein n=1 Tax=Bdellovibrio sp. HCB-162 TaxID=3394234 RepID=UPI0039BC7AE4